MSRHYGQTSSQLDTHSDKQQLATLKQQNRRPISDIKPFEIAQLQNAEKLKLLLNTALQLKQHHFAIDQQLLLLLHKKALQVSRIAFFHI